MAITPIWRAGAETQHIGELDAHAAATYGSGNMTVSSTQARNGTYSFRNSGSSIPRGRYITSTTQVRSGMSIFHNGVSGAGATNNAIIFLTTGTYDIIVQWASDTNTIEIVVNGVVQASIAAASSGMTTTSTWYHCGLNVKANGTAGWVSFYVDGVQKTTWTGNTGTAINGVFFGGGNTAATWVGFNYNDDFYVDDTVGETDAAPPAIELPYLPVSGAGSNTGWSVYGVGSNYQAVDDTGAPNDLTDFVFGTSSGLNDSYAVTNTTGGVTVPSGRSIAAVIPCAWAQRTDAATARTLKLGTLLSGTTVLGSAQALPVGSFGMIQERQATKPGGGSWSTSDVDSMEYVQETAGSF
jgi:hypothetical protein